MTHNITNDLFDKINNQKVTTSDVSEWSDESVEQFFNEVRWPKEIKCAHCGAPDKYIVKSRSKNKIEEFRCCKCDRVYNPLTNTVFSSSFISYRQILLAFIEVNNNPNISTPQLAKAIGVKQKNAIKLRDKIIQRNNTLIPKHILEIIKKLAIGYVVYQFFDNEYPPFLWCVVDTSQESTDIDLKTYNYLIDNKLISERSDEKGTETLVATLSCLRIANNHNYSKLDKELKEAIEYPHYNKDKILDWLWNCDLFYTDFEIKLRLLTIDPNNKLFHR